MANGRKSHRLFPQSSHQQGSPPTMNSSLNRLAAGRPVRVSLRIALLSAALVAVTACARDSGSPSLEEIASNLPTYLARYPGVQGGRPGSCMELKVDLVRAVRSGSIDASSGLVDRTVDSSRLRNGQVVYFEGLAKNVIVPIKTANETLFTGTLETAGSTDGLLLRSSSQATNSRVNEGSLMKGGASSPMMDNRGAYVCGFGVAVVGGRLNGIAVTDAIEFTPR